MRRLTVIAVLAALLLTTTGCGSLGMFSLREWADLAQPVVRQLVSYVVCGVQARNDGIQLTLSPTAGASLSCNTRRTIPLDSPVLRTVSKLGPGAVIEIEDEAMSAAEFSAENASSPPRIGRLKVVREAPR